MFEARNHCNFINLSILTNNDSCEAEDGLAIYF